MLLNHVWKDFIRFFFWFFLTDCIQKKRFIHFAKEIALKFLCRFLLYCPLASSLSIEVESRLSGFFLTKFQECRLLWNSHFTILIACDWFSVPNCISVLSNNFFDCGKIDELSIGCVFKSKFWVWRSDFDLFRYFGMFKAKFVLRTSKDYQKNSHFHNSWSWFRKFLTCFMKFRLVFISSIPWNWFLQINDQNLVNVVKKQTINNFQYLLMTIITWKILNCSNN